MTRRTTLFAVALLASVVGVAAAVRLVGGGPGGRGTEDGGRGATGSATRLGPHDGEAIAEYLARTRAALDRRHDGTPTYALVAADHYLTPAQVPAALPGVTVVRALVRVPLPRVQTRLFEFPARTPADVRGGMVAAASELQTEARSTSDRVAVAVALAQAGQLRQDCACVLGAVVHAVPDALVRLARSPSVRAVEPAPQGEPLARLSFAPLLPEQRYRVEPPPDDGAAALVPPPPPSPAPSPSPAGSGPDGPTGAAPRPDATGGRPGADP